ncbi:DUF599 domain-containing protein [Gammaproteobacteria bacterium]
MSEQFSFSGSAILLLVVYHVRLFYLLKCQPERTSIGTSNNIRTRWVERIMTEHRDVLAVQTLRNLTMAASFLASTAIMIDLWLMNAILGDPSRENTFRILATDGFSQEKLWIHKLILLTIVFMFCFANFMLSIRYYNHVAIFINVIPEENNVRHFQKPGFFIDMSQLPQVEIGIRRVAETLNLGAAHHTLGMRGYYLVLPLSLWLIDARWFFVGTLLILLVLRRVDSSE